jgi:hypothetical protein
MSDVRKWLKAIWLAQYAGILNRRISTSLCSSKLTSRHSREDIDVSTAGRRLRIRHAIAKLKSKATLDIPENAAGGSKMKDLLDLPPGTR